MHTLRIDVLEGETSIHERIDVTFWRFEVFERTSPPSPHPPTSQTFKFSNNDDKDASRTFSRVMVAQRNCRGEFTGEIYTEVISVSGNSQLCVCAVTLRKKKKFFHVFFPTRSPNSCASSSIKRVHWNTPARFYPCQSVWQRGEHFRKRSCIMEHYEAFYSTGSSDFERFSCFRSKWKEIFFLLLRRKIILVTKHSAFRMIFFTGTCTSQNATC